MQDVIELRLADWKLRREIGGPKTIEEIHADVAKEKQDALMPVPVRRHAVEDRVWSVGVSSGQQQLIAVGTAATRGTAPLRLYDLLTGAHLMDLGSDLKKGAGMLDLAWLSPST